MVSCTQCGASLDNAAQFCTQCGASVTTTVQSSGAATAAQRAPVAPVSDTPIADLAHAERSGFRPMVWIVALVAMVLAVGTYLLLDRQKPSGPAPIIDGRASAPSQTFGLELYPGARLIPSSNYGVGIVIASFETTDSPSQVMGYYKVRFPVSEITATESGQALVADMNGRQVTVRADSLVHGSRVSISFSH